MSDFCSKETVVGEAMTGIKVQENNRRKIIKYFHVSKFKTVNCFENILFTLDIILF